MSPGRRPIHRGNTPAHSNKPRRTITNPATTRNRPKSCIPNYSDAARGRPPRLFLSFTRRPDLHFAPGAKKLLPMPVQFRDYYETLGVSKTATEDEIRSAFRKLAGKDTPEVA